MHQWYFLQIMGTFSSSFEATFVAIFLLGAFTPWVNWKVSCTQKLTHWGWEKMTPFPMRHFRLYFRACNWLHFGAKFFERPMVFGISRRSWFQMRENLFPLQWRHNERDGISNHPTHDCLLTGYSGADQRKHDSSASLAFVWGIHRTKGQ